LFGVTDLETDTEIVNARVTVVGTTSKPILTPPRGRPNAGSQRRRRARIGGEEFQVPIYLRPNLEVGQHVLGPAVIEQDDTTTVVPRGFEVQVDAFGNLIGRRT
jgi:N-methylhydantoinase A